MDKYIGHWYGEPIYIQEKDKIQKILAYLARARRNATGINKKKLEEQFVELRRFLIH